MGELAGDGAGGHLPPVPQAGAVEGPVSTYYTEQRSSTRCDIFAACPPQGQARASRPQVRRLPTGCLHENIKCTVLPALSSIDRLLSPPQEGRGEAEDRRAASPSRAQRASEEDRRREEARDLCLPLLPEAQRSAREPEEGTSRLYPGRRFSSRFTPVPSDEEFRGWLTLSPRGSMTSRQAPAGCNSSLASHCDSTLSFRNASEDNEGGEAKPCAWLIMLLRSTYQNSKLTPQQVALCLVEQLGLSMQEAEQRARDAQARLLAVVGRCADRREAFTRLHALRRRGLAVQVASEAGAPLRGEEGESPGGESPKGTMRRAAARDYGELFRQSLRGTGTLLPRLPPAVRSKPRRHGAGRWKGEGAEVAIEVLPEDPVGAFFEAERERQAAERERESLLYHRPHRKTESTPKPEGRCRSLLQKHRATIRKTAEVVVAQREQDRAGLSPPSSADPPEAGKEPRTSTLWDVVLDAVVPKQKIPAARKEACQMMRFFVYGCVGNEGARTIRESEKVFYESIGTREQVDALQRMWQRLDQDNSGRVDILELRAFAEVNMKEKLEALLADGSPSMHGRRQSLRGASAVPAWCQITTPEEIPDFVAQLCLKLGQLLLGKKSSFCIEDMMRLIWPCAQQRDLKLMRGWGRELVNSSRRERTPPVLPQADYAGLCSVFEYFDKDRRGTIRMEDLVAKGLIYEEQAPAFFQQWDRNGDGLLDLLEFCEMMCPIGFRAHAEAEIGSAPDGTRLVYDRQQQCWLVGDREDEVLASAEPQH